jgi:hypothetical protein
MSDLLDRLKENNSKSKDLLDQLNESNGVSYSGSQDTFLKSATIQQLKKTGTAGGAFFADMGATIHKVLPNMKRLVNPDDKEAIAEIKEIEEFQDSLRTAFPSAVFGGEVVLPAATATATMGLGVIPALAAAPVEAAAFTGSEQNPRTNAIIASVLPFIPDAVKKLGGGVGELFESVVRRGGDIAGASPEQQAGRAVKRFIDEANVSPEDILSERAALGEGSTLADVKAMNGLSQVTALTPSGGTYMAKFEQRQVTQQPRIMKALSDITGKKAQNFTGDLKMFIQERSAAASPYYTKAFEQEFVPSEGFTHLFSRLKGSGALKEAVKIAKIEGRKIDADAIGYADLHTIKIAIDDLIGAANSAGSINKANALRKLKNNLLDEIEINNPDYKMGRLQYSGDSGVINSAELGVNIFNPKKMGAKLTTDQLKDEVERMSTDEFTAFQGGMAKAVADKIADVPDTADAAGRLWKKPKIREVLRVAFENDTQFEGFLSSLEKETQFTDTLRKLYQGSQTGQKDAGKAALKTGDIGALAPFKKILKGELTVDGITELSRLMFDSKVTNDEIRRVMVKAGIINETATTKAVAAMRKKWDSVWSRINLPSVTTQSKAAVSAALAPALNDEEQP